MIRRQIYRGLVKLPPMKKQVAENENLKNLINDKDNTVAALDSRTKDLENELNYLKGNIKESYDISLLVFEKDLIKSRNIQPVREIKKSKKPLVINWVIPPTGTGSVSGGHKDIFRTIAYLESKDYKCNLYFYDPMKSNKLEDLKSSLVKNYPKIKANIYYNSDEFEECNAIFATSWNTAYPVVNFKLPAKKYYYVQDFESYFNAKGSHTYLAENTYTFGLKGITLGKWLSKKLTKEYGMECEHFDFGFNKQDYFLTNKQQRNKIIYYARPSTPRRGFEVSIVALSIFHSKHPDVEINVIGEDISKYKLDFPYINHGMLGDKRLNELYNECAAGLVLSFTNMSLIPLEMIAAGCVPVVNEEDNTTLVNFNKYVEYTSPHPVAIAEALANALDNQDITGVSTKFEREIDNYNWNKSNEVIESILSKDLVG